MIIVWDWLEEHSKCSWNIRIKLPIEQLIQESIFFYSVAVPNEFETDNGFIIKYQIK